MPKSLFYVLTVRDANSQCLPSQVSDGIFQFLFDFTLLFWETAFKEIESRKMNPAALSFVFHF